MGFLDRLSQFAQRVFQPRDGFGAQTLGRLDAPRQIHEPRFALNVTVYACFACQWEFPDFQALVWHATKGECAPPPVVSGSKVN